MVDRTNKGTSEASSSSIRPREAKSTRSTSRAAGYQGSSSRKESTASGRESQCHQRALKKRFTKAQWASMVAMEEIEASLPLQSTSPPQPASAPQLREERQQDWSPESTINSPSLQAACFEEEFAPFDCLASTSGVPAGRARKSAPEATFTATAAGFRSGENQGPGLTPEMHMYISEVISQGIEAALTGKGCSPTQLEHVLPPILQIDMDLLSLGDHHFPPPSLHSEDSLVGEGNPRGPGVIRG